MSTARKKKAPAPSRAPRRPVASKSATRLSTGASTPAERAQAALRWLEATATGRDRDNLQRFGITATNALGVSKANIQRLAKELGKSHELALALWETDCYEARMLTSLVDEPARVTSAQMDRWCRAFDNWALCDTLCFHLFDRTPLAFGKVALWSKRPDEFVRRAGFALLASLAGHDREASDAQFLAGLELVERHASDERNFVKKAVSWALRRIGGRNTALNAAALALARRLADSAEPAARWVGKDALRDLARPAMAKRLARATQARPAKK